MDIISCPAQNQQSCEIILEFMDEQGVREIRAERYGVMKQTNTFVFTFNTPESLTVIKIGFIQTKADVMGVKKVRSAIKLCSYYFIICLMTFMSLKFFKVGSLDKK